MSDYRCRTCSSSEHYKTKYGRRCAPCMRRRSQAWRDNKSPEFKRDQRRRAQLRSRYQITPEDFDAMLVNQGGVCAICKRTSRKNLAVDHNHKTGAVRGLLCPPCNSKLGWLEDFHGEAMAYLGWESAIAEATRG